MEMVTLVEGLERGRVCVRVVKGWIEEVVLSDKVLAGLETELTGQQSELENSRVAAETLIEKINTLDSLRNALPDEIRRVKRASVVEYDEDEDVIVESFWDSTLSRDCCRSSFRRRRCLGSSSLE